MNFECIFHKHIISRSLPAKPFIRLSRQKPSHKIYAVQCRLPYIAVVEKHVHIAFALSGCCLDRIAYIANHVGVKVKRRKVLDDDALWDYTTI